MIRNRLEEIAVFLFDEGVRMQLEVSASAPMISKLLEARTVNEVSSFLIGLSNRHSFGTWRFDRILLPMWPFVERDALRKITDGSCQQLIPNAPCTARESPFAIAGH